MHQQCTSHGFHYSPLVIFVISHHRHCGACHSVPPPLRSACDSRAASAAVTTETHGAAQLAAGVACDANGTESNAALARAEDEKFIAEFMEAARKVFELIDEDDLLDEEDLKQKVATKSDCAPDAAGKRKACKNCSCGLREMQENGDDNVPAPPKSACGSCGLGDAYRCADCPYLGKPAFKPGEEIKLADSMFGEGAHAHGETKVATGGGNGGVVKLDLDDTMDF